MSDTPFVWSPGRLNAILSELGCLELHGGFGAQYFNDVHFLLFSSLVEVYQPASLVELATRIRGRTKLQLCRDLNLDIEIVESGGTLLDRLCDLFD